MIRLRAFWSSFLLDGSGGVLIPGLQIDLGPLTPWHRFRQLVQKIDRLVYEEIARRRKEALQGRTDVMAMLLAARDENDGPMSDDEIRDELITMLVAGHETTATSLSCRHRCAKRDFWRARAGGNVFVMADGPDPARNRIAVSLLDAHQGNGPSTPSSNCLTLSRSA